MEYKTKTPKLMTTHYPENKKPRTLAQPVIINGKRSLAYMKGNKIESYVPWEEAQEQVFADDLPEYKIGF